MLVRSLIGASVLLLSGQAAHAYRYSGPQTVVCRSIVGSAGCSLQPGYFGTVSIRVPANPPDNMTLLTIMPKSIARGGFLVREMRFKLKQTVPSAGASYWQLSVERDISYNQVSRTVTYVFQDPIVVSPDGKPDTGMTIFMSDTAGWVESYASTSPLSPVTTIPVFFGYGPAESATFNVFKTPADKSATSYAVVEEDALYSSVAAHYNAAAVAPNQPGSSYPTVYIQPSYPFLRQGDRRNAAALVSVL